MELDSRVSPEKFVCEICHKKFRYNVNYKVHLKKVHSIVKTKSI